MAGALSEIGIRAGLLRVPAQKADEFLRDFFIGHLGYSRIEKGRHKKPAEPDYWRMVIPADGAQPFAIAYERGLSNMTRQRVSRLYIEKVISHRDSSRAVEPVLYGFTDGARLILFSADPARNRNDRFDLSEQTWQFACVREKVEQLHISRLQFQTRLGIKSPAIDFLFDTRFISADKAFIGYAHAAREELMRAVIGDRRSLASVIYHLLESPEDREPVKTRFVDKNRRLKKSLEKSHQELETRLGDAVAEAVDTLLLRYIMIRFLDALHPESSGGLPKSDAALKRGKPKHESTNAGRAAREIEDAMLRKPSSRGARVIQNFLGRTADSRQQCGFRYEDLRPQTLQDYYESALVRPVRLTYDEQSESLEVTAGNGQRRRKELGAYYTDPRLCRFMVERTVKPIFEQRLEELRKAIASKSLAAARRAFEAVVYMSVCDPTMGSAPFLRSAFDYLSEQYLAARRTIAEAVTALPDLFEEVSRDFPFLASRGCKMDEEGVARWEWHILRQMLYGIDIDLKAVRIACHTFALSPLNYLKESERFPSFFNINLKVGNALISPVKPADRPKLAEHYGKEISELIALRRRAKRLPSTTKGYETLKTLLERIEGIKKPVIDELVHKQVTPILQEFTEKLRPFCCEIEFPELFFNEDGTLKAAAGFDVIIGNPPWEEAYVKDKEFLTSHGFDTAAKVEQVTKRCPELRPLYDNYLAVINKWQEWAGSSAYQRQLGGRHRNYWRMATETSWNLLRSAGRISLVVPAGITADEGPVALREWLFKEGEAGRFITFEKQNEVFSGAQAFTVFTFTRGKPTTKVGHIDGLIRAEELKTLADPVWVDLALVRRMSPGYLTIPAVRDALDAQILEKLYLCPLITDKAARFHAEPRSGDLNITLDRDKFVGGLILVLEGKHVAQYRTAEPSLARFSIPKPHLRGGADPAQYRITWRDISGTLDARRLHATMLPKQCVTSHLLNTLVVTGSDADRLLILGVMNSLVFEWRVRQVARSNHIQPMALRQMPCPRPQPGDADRELIVNRAARLLIVDPRLQDLAHFGPQGPIVGLAARQEALCEIDAAVARLFGLTGEEVDRILSLYDKITEGTKSRVRI